MTELLVPFTVAVQDYVYVKELTIRSREELCNCHFYSTKVVGTGKFSVSTDREQGLVFIVSCHSELFYRFSMTPPHILTV